MKPLRWIRQKKAQLKLYLGIALVCLIISWALHLVIEEGQNAVSHLETLADVETPDQRTIEKLKASLNDNLDEAEAERVKDAYRGALEDTTQGRHEESNDHIYTPEEFKALRKSLENSLSAQEIEKLNKAYRAMQSFGQSKSEHE